jgi:hypothetical protein
MELLIISEIIEVVLLIPIKMAATWVGAKDTGLMSCLLALILAGAIQKELSMVVPGAS